MNDEMKTEVTMSELSYDDDEDILANANDSMRVSMRALIRAVKTARDTHKRAIAIMYEWRSDREGDKYALMGEDRYDAGGEGEHMQVDSDDKDINDDLIDEIDYELRCRQDDIDDAEETLSMLSTLIESLT